MNACTVAWSSFAQALAIGALFGIGICGALWWGSVYAAQQARDAQDAERQARGPNVVSMPRGKNLRA